MKHNEKSIKTRRNIKNNGTQSELSIYLIYNNHVVW
jgi:hypothetical protein